MYGATISFISFFAVPISKELYIFFKKKDDHGFLSYTKHYLSAKNLQLMMMPTWVGSSQKFDFFV